MKKLFIILLLGFLSSCAVSKEVAYEKPTCVYDTECEITGIHDHVNFIW